MIHRDRSLGVRTLLGTLAACTLLASWAAGACAAGEAASAPAWPNLLSEAGRRAAMALPASSPRHLEPTLEDIEAAANSAPGLGAKARYDHWRAAAATPANVRANDPTGDQGAAPSTAADTQSECAVAAFGSNVVVAWNDSKGLRLGSPTTVSGFSYSTDGGATFTDGGSVPLLNTGDQSYGDCTLDADANGNFYLATIYLTAGNLQQISVHRGTFAGGILVWGAPVIAASVADVSQALDKSYLTVDKTTGNVYVSFTRFGSSVGIEVVRGTNQGVTWSSPVVLDNTSDGIQGSRPIVGPEGNLYVCWQSGWGSLNCDLSSTTGTIALRRCRNPIATPMIFDPTVSVGSVQTNWMAYWSGNLRGNALFFPDIAVDRSGGPNNGNLYVAWNEAAPWGPPGNGTGVTTAEGEPNNLPNDAGVKTINPGDNASGSISTSGDYDYWKINVTAGSTLMLQLEPQGFLCPSSNTLRNFQIRLFKGVAGTAGDTLLANSNLNQFASAIVGDMAENATYYFRVRNVATSGSVVTGTYTVKTRLVTYGAPSPGRDMRDIVVARSLDQGATFQPEVRVNDDAARLDNCIPAITCDGRGSVHVFWYDARDGAGARILRSYYSAVSSDGGATWGANQRLSNELQYFNLNTVAVPNYGEYNQACADGDRVYATWSDERLSHAPYGQSGVDAYVSAETITPVAIADLEATADENGVSLAWRLPEIGEVLGVRVERADAAAGPYAERTPAALPPAPVMSFVDASVEAGRTYWYRLVLESVRGAVPAGAPIRITVTERANLRTALHPPLERGGGGPVEIRYSIGSRAGSLRLGVYDAGGRLVRVLEQDTPAPGEHLRTWDRRDDAGAQVARGVYLVQLRAGGVRLARKLVLVHD